MFRIISVIVSLIKTTQNTSSSLTLLPCQTRPVPENTTAMGDFITNLWESVFTAGTTPTLLLATNATFALLQITLAALLAFTYSIHFVILSVLCGGLWWSINWFADEVRQAQETEEEAKRIRKLQARERGGGDGESADDEGGDTETEKEKDDVPVVEHIPTAGDQALKDEILDEIKQQGRATQGAATTGLEAPESTKHRKSAGNVSVDGSTDSEWEKVDSER